MVWSHNPFFPQAKPSGPAPGSAPPPADNASDAEAGLVPKEEIPGEGMPSTGTPSTDEAGPSSSSAEGSDTAHQHHYHRPHFHSDPALQHHVHMPRLHHHIHEMRKPSEKFTPYQIFYIFVLDGLGAAIISGGVNFAIAYGRMLPFLLSQRPPSFHNFFFIPSFRPEVLLCISWTSRSFPSFLARRCPAWCPRLILPSHPFPSSRHQTTTTTIPPPPLSLPPPGTPY